MAANGQKQTADGSVANNGDHQHVENENRESERNHVLGNDDYLLLEGINITSSNPPNPTETSSRPKIPYYPLSENESAFLKACMEEKIATLPVHTPDCGHPNLGRDIDDCGNNMCWVIAAMDCLCMRLKIKGGNYELIQQNCDKLMKCYEEENNGYPYIIKKAFKYIKEHNVSKDAFYPSEADCNIITPHEIPEEVKALRISGFQMIDHEDELALIMAIRNGPCIGGVRHSPEFIMLGNKIYCGSDNEIKIEGKYCNHGLVVMGCKFDEKEWKNYWTVKNSEGTRWGDKGYGRVARDSSLPDNRKHLLTSTMYPIFE